MKVRTGLCVRHVAHVPAEPVCGVSDSIGEQHLVREFDEAAFSYLGLKYRNYVRGDPRLLQPVDVETLLGDTTKSRQRLGWSSTVTFTELVHEMVDTDVRLLRESK